MNNKEILIKNFDKIHTTKLGEIRIQKNLKLNENIKDYCNKILNEQECEIQRKGKNYYLKTKDCIITINAHSFTIITAHKC